MDGGGQGWMKGIGMEWAETDGRAGVKGGDGDERGERERERERERENEGGRPGGDGRDGWEGGGTRGGIWGIRISPVRSKINEPLTNRN